MGEDAKSRNRSGRYAGYLTYTDFEISRLVNHLKEIEQLDNTLIFISIGDNGASKEGILNGDIDRSLWTKPLTEPENINYKLNRIREIGRPTATERNYLLGWSQACDTPFKFWKQDANSEGGTHNPLIVYWLKGIKDKGGIRTQASMSSTSSRRLPIWWASRRLTISEESSRTPSREFPWHTRSTMPRRLLTTRCSITTFLDRDRFMTPGGKRNWLIQAALSLGIYKAHSLFDENAWELYNLNEDPTERIDLATRYPEKLAEQKS